MYLSVKQIFVRYQFNTKWGGVNYDMSCNFPLIRCETYETYKNVSGGISYKVEWAERDMYDTPEGKKFLENKYRRVTPIPCGQCIQCKLDYSREWANRGMLEMETGCVYSCDEFGNPLKTIPYPDGRCWFITLTYADEYLPQATICNTETGEKLEGISLDLKDVQRFIKRLRYHYPDFKIKYLVAGEYGGQTLRPHYHLIIYNVPLEQEQFKKIATTPNGDPLWNLDKLTNIWGNGHVIIGRVTWESIGYVMRYNLKKVKGKDETWYNMQGMRKEFTTKSPNIGKQFFNQNMRKIYQTDSIPISNRKRGMYVKPPKAFDRALRDIDTDLYDTIKEQRKANADTQNILLNRQTDMTPEERRKVAEERMQAVMKDLRTEI